MYIECDNVPGLVGGYLFVGLLVRHGDDAVRVQTQDEADEQQRETQPQQHVTPRRVHPAAP